MSTDNLDSDGLRGGGPIRFALAICIAAGLVYALVHLGLWHGVVKLN